MTSDAVKCCLLTLVLHVCIYTAAGARVVDFESPSSLTTSNAVRSNSEVNGNQHKRDLLQQAVAPILAPAPAPAPFSQPRATPAATTRATPQATAGPIFSTAADVPAITSVASLSGFATVADFNATQQARFTSTLVLSILRNQGVVANCSVTKVEQGSIKVANTLTFPGADASAALAARDSVATALSGSNVADYFGTSFGEVTVSSVRSTTAANPVKSGAAALGASLVGMMGGLAVLALTVMTV